MGEQVGAGRVAVVIGGSIAGALAAGVLAEHVDRVIMLERDVLGADPGPRRGVPHAQHFHALLAKGREIMEEVYPGFTDTAVQRGANLTCMTQNCLAIRRYGPAPRFESSMKVLLVSRELIEWALRHHAERHPRIELRAGCEVEGIHIEEGRVAGVQVRGADGTVAEIRADIVVDASGRTSMTPTWLEAAGITPPEEMTVNAHWGYTSCFVQVPEDFDPGFLAFSALPKGGVVGDHPTKTRGASMWVQDGERRWILTAMGSAGDHPPADEAGLRAYIASLEYDELNDALTKATVLGKPQIWRNTVNRLRRYDQIEMPDGYLVVGDAFAAFNPVYGQGMTVASMGAANLRAELDVATTLEGVSARVQARLAEDALFCWGMATGADYRVEGVVGPPPPPGATERTAFMDRVEALASEDTDVYLKFWQTAQLIRTPEWLDDPVLQARIQADWDRLGALVGADG